MDYDSVKIVGEGKEAIKQIDAFNPDLILMDITLNGKMDGIEASKHILKKKDIPIIFITAHEDIETLHKAKNIEPSSYIIKPIQTVNDLRPSIELAFHNSDIKRTLKNNQNKLEQIKHLILSSETLDTAQNVQTSDSETIQFTKEDFDMLPGKLDAIANADRFLILEVLKNRQLKLSEIQKLIEKSQSTSSHHIKKLESEGFIKGWKKGKFTFYSIDKVETGKFLHLWKTWIAVKNKK